MDPNNNNNNNNNNINQKFVDQIMKIFINPSDGHEISIVTGVDPGWYTCGFAAALVNHGRKEYRFIASGINNFMADDNEKQKKYKEYTEPQLLRLLHDDIYGPGKCSFIATALIQAGKTIFEQQMKRRINIVVTAYMCMWYNHVYGKALLNKESPDFIHDYPEIQTMATVHRVTDTKTKEDLHQLLYPYLPVETLHQSDAGGQVLAYMMRAYPNYVPVPNSSTKFEHLKCTCDNSKLKHTKQKHSLTIFFEQSE
jgi:hypothetical protein